MSGADPLNTRQGVYIMAIAVSTQFVENYGAHDEPQTDVWKFKGGRTYKVIGTDARPANAFALVTNYLLDTGHMANFPWTLEVPQSHPLEVIPDDQTHDSEGSSMTVLVFDRKEVS